MWAAISGRCLWLSAVCQRAPSAAGKSNNHQVLFDGPCLPPSAVALLSLHDGRSARAPSSLLPPDALSARRSRHFLSFTRVILATMHGIASFLAVLSVPAILCNLATATPHVVSGHAARAEKHRRLAEAAEQSTNATLSKRDSDRFTYYYVDVGEVACGGFYQNNDFVRVTPSLSCRPSLTWKVDCGSEHRGNSCGADSRIRY